jgi:hypothetical protein
MPAAKQDHRLIYSWSRPSGRLLALLFFTCIGGLLLFSFHSFFQIKPLPLDRSEQMNHHSITLLQQHQPRSRRILQRVMDYSYRAQEDHYTALSQRSTAQLPRFTSTLSQHQLTPRALPTKVRQRDSFPSVISISDLLPPLSLDSTLNTASKKEAPTSPTLALEWAVTSGPLAQRPLLQQPPAPTDLSETELRFSIHVSPRGLVTHALPLQLTDSSARLIQLRQQLQQIRFSPLTDSTRTQIGILTLKPKPSL